MKPRSGMAAVLAASLFAFATARAADDTVMFPKNYAKGVLYATVDRPDLKQVRDLYAAQATIDSAKNGALPSGTVLTMVQYKAKLDDQGNPVKDANGKLVKGDLLAYFVLEKRTGWGADQPADKRVGEWKFQAFTPDQKVNDTANITACAGCHIPHAADDYLITRAKLKSGR